MEDRSSKAAWSGDAERMTALRALPHRWLPEYEPFHNSWSLIAGMPQQVT
jgi:hypothetical protein